jgi:hypothetical protein
VLADAIRPKHASASANARFTLRGKPIKRIGVVRPSCRTRTLR